MGHAPSALCGALAALPLAWGAGLWENLPKARNEDYRVHIYIYDLEDVFHSIPHHAIESSTRNLGATCDWMLTACTETGVPGPHTMTRQNAAEVIILRKLFANPFLVHDPLDADILVVPALTGTACYSGQFGSRCNGPLESYPDDLFDRLPFYNAQTRHRHLFLCTLDRRTLPLDIQAQSLVLSRGASWGDRPGHIVVPPSVTDAELQPGQVRLNQGRDILFFMAAVPNNPMRREIFRQLEAIKGSKVVLNEMVRPIGTNPYELKSAKYISSMMLSSIFCVCPPSENSSAGSKRVFDALLSGCIPVIISFPTIWGSGVSWWRVNGPPIEWALPFASVIDWRRLVVEVKEEQLLGGDYGLLFATFQADVKAKQQYLAEVRDLLVYDLQGGRRDAFSLIMDEIGRTLPRLYHASLVPRPLVCEVIPLTRFMFEEGNKGWSSSYGEFACDLLQFWHRPGDFWGSNYDVKLDPLRTSGFVQSSNFSTEGGREVVFYRLKEGVLREGFEVHTLSKQKGYVACANPQFPKALQLLGSFETAKTAPYKDGTKCQIPPDPFPTVTTDSVWQMVVAVCNYSLAYVHAQDLAKEFEEHWSLGLQHEFQLVVYDACDKQAGAETQSAAFLEHILTLKIQQEQGEKVPEVVVFLAGMLPQEIEQRFKVIDQLQVHYQELKDAKGDWMIVMDGNRDLGMVCDGYMSFFRHSCPALEHNRLKLMSPQILAFPSSMIFKVPEVHLQIEAAFYQSFPSQLDGLSVLIFKALRSSWRKGHAEVVADARFRLQNDSECMSLSQQSLEGLHYGYPAFSGYLLSATNQVLRRQAFGCLGHGGVYSIIDVGLPQAFYQETEWARPSTKLWSLQTAFGAWVHRNKTAETEAVARSLFGEHAFKDKWDDPMLKALTNVPDEEFSVFSLCHASICSQQEIIELGWIYYLDHILQLSLVGRPNWAQQNLPGPPPTVQISWTFPDLSDMEVGAALRTGAPELLDLWKQQP